LQSFTGTTRLVVEPIRSGQAEQGDGLLNKRIAAAFAAILLIYLALNLYIAWNLWVFLDTVCRGVSPLWPGAAAAVGAFSYFIARAGRRRFPRPAQAAEFIGVYWMAVFEYAVLFLPPANLLAWLLMQAGLNRTAVIGGIGAFVLAAIAFLIIRGTWNAWQPVIRRHRITVAKQPRDRKQLRIAVASDLHLGAIVGRRHLERLVRCVEEIKPDLVLLPGDVLDDHIEPYIRNNLAETMRKLQAPLGVYAVLGNHEYYGGNLPLFLEQLKAGGIRVLLDETAAVGDVVIAGRKDITAEAARFGGRLPLNELLAGIERSYPILLLDHQPVRLDEAEEQGVDIVFCGHTHRGQMAPNHLLTRRLFEVDWGYKRKGGTHVFVSSGFGTWGPPVRIGSRSEVLAIDVNFQ
jgi:hypothetical protein